MLIRYAFDNFRSFGESSALNMVPANRLRKKKHHIITAKSDNEFDVLRGAVIYGSNASGKSNFVKSLSFLKSLISNPVKPKKKIGVEPFSMGREREPLSFEIEFMINGFSYNYYLSINNESVIAEKLSLIRDGGNKGSTIFIRDSSRNVTRLSWGERIGSELEETKSWLNFFIKDCPNNRTLLAEIHERGIGVKFTYESHLKNVISWFLNSLQIVYPGSRYKLILSDLRKSDEKIKFYSMLLKALDTGIDSLELSSINLSDIPEEIVDEVNNIIREESETSNGQIIASTFSGDYIFDIIDDEVKHVQVTKSIHKIKNDIYKFNLKDESDGTRRIIDLAPALYNTSVGAKGKVYVIDELDRSLHPLVSKGVIDLFYSQEFTATGQLITTTHESSLLDNELLRRDSIWFVQKEDNQASTLYSLSDYKALRSDKDIRKAYLSGAFGGIPFDSLTGREVTDYLKELANDLT